jgi:inosose dehydratase
MILRIGGAPISWGVCEIPGWGPWPPYERVLDEVAAAGFEGTELGPWGFLPADPERLAAELDRRGLAMASGFVPLDLKNPADAPASEARIRQTAALLQRLGAQHILLSDAGDRVRERVAGRPELTRTHGLTADEWPGYLERLQRLARLSLEEYGLVSCFHPEAGIYVENPDEIATLLDRTEPSLVRLCLDTGQIAFGGGDPLAIMERYHGRLSYIHLKDIDLPRLRGLLAEGRTYVETAKQDVFVEPGRGSLDLQAFLRSVQAMGYSGWIVAEQDRVWNPEIDTLGSAGRSRQYICRSFGV